MSFQKESRGLYVLAFFGITEERRPTPIANLCLFIFSWFSICHLHNTCISSSDTLEHEGFERCFCGRKAMKKETADQSGPLFLLSAL
jgi:hypothetical protein